MLLGDIVGRNAKYFGDKSALKDEERTITFRQANDRANAFLHGLMSLGVKKEDKIAVVLSNRVEYTEILMALPKAGIVAVALNWFLVGKELEYLINNSDAETVIFDVLVEEVIESIRPKLGMVKNYIVVDRTEKPRPASLIYETLIKNNPTEPVSADVSESDLAYILYSSGTTGLPKGVQLTHRNVLTNLIHLGLEVQPKPTDRYFSPLPLFHLAGQSFAMLFFWFGCTVITARKFDAKAAFETIQTEQPNVVHFVPAMLNMLINYDELEHYNLSCVELVVYGASPIAVAQLRRCIEIFECKFIQCAGLTEASGAVAMLRPEDHVTAGSESALRRLGSAGRPLKFCEVKILDETGNEVPPNTPGELFIKGDGVMKGYWKLPEVTLETINDGWLRSGDICMQDEDGYIYYVDRAKDMICRGGENIYPKEIENVILTHPSVCEVCVISVPDERLQEEIMAIVKLKDGERLTERELMELCSKNLASFKRPRYVEFVEELPKTSSGKILKRELKQQYKDLPLPRKMRYFLSQR